MSYLCKYGILPVKPHCLEYNYMDKKPTMKDVAEMAGVSKATVSYVLNKREDQSIPEATRKKVLHVMNLLNYVPNRNAVAFASNKTGNLLVIANNDNSYRAAETLRFFSALSENAADWRVIYQDYKTARKIDNADAAVCVNFPLADFKALGSENFIPLFAYDCVVDEPLFFQINEDFSHVGRRPFATLNRLNEELRERIKLGAPDCVFVSNPAQMLSLPEEFVTDSHVLFTEAKSIGKKPAFIDDTFEKRVDTVIESIRSVLSRSVSKEHDIRI